MEQVQVGIWDDLLYEKKNKWWLRKNDEIKSTLKWFKNDFKKNYKKKMFTKKNDLNMIKKN